MSRGPARASIFMYHRLSGTIVDRQEAIYTVTPSDFDAQMRLLADKGVPVLALEDLVSGSFSHLAVALTFDDGCRTDFTVALPVLRAQAFDATFFVTPARIGDSGFLTWEDIGQLMDEGMTIGSHGLEHRPIDRLDLPELERQLAESKTLLEDHLKREVDMFALPGGKGGPSVARLARQVGYRIILGSKPARIAEERLPAILPRFAVRRGRGTVHFEGLVTQRIRPRMEEFFRYNALKILRRALGARFYERLRLAVSTRMMGHRTSEQA